MSVFTKLAAATRRTLAVSASAVTVSAASNPAKVASGAVTDFKDRRRRRRVRVPSMYTSVVVRSLQHGHEPLEGHVLNLSETGISIQVDELLSPGDAVALEFTIAGLGMMRAEGWPTFVLGAEVIRADDVDDAPQGPYKIALRFERVPTIVQAQIARFTMNASVAK